MRRLLLAFAAGALLATAAPAAADAGWDRAIRALERISAALERANTLSERCRK